MWCMLLRLGCLVLVCACLILYQVHSFTKEACTYRIKWPCAPRHFWLDLFHVFFLACISHRNTHKRIRRTWMIFLCMFIPSPLILCLFLTPPPPQADPVQLVTHLWAPVARFEGCHVHPPRALTPTRWHLPLCPSREPAKRCLSSCCHFD